MARLTVPEALKLAKESGFTSAEAVIMVAIWMGESGLETNTFNGSCCYGLAQINTSAHHVTPEQARDPRFAAMFSHQLFQRAGNSFRDWEVYTVGKDNSNNLDANLKRISGQVPNSYSVDIFADRTNEYDKLYRASGVGSGAAGGGGLLPNRALDPSGSIGELPGAGALDTMFDLFSDLYKKFFNYKLWVRVVLFVVGVILLYEAVRTLTGSGPSSITITKAALKSSFNRKATEAAEVA